jgi:hypothetical protein
MIRRHLVNGTLALWTRSEVLTNLQAPSELALSAPDPLKEFNHGTVEKTEYSDPMGR